MGAVRSGEGRLTINSSDRIKSLDGLRGIAILLVFFCHYVPQDRHDPLSAAARLGWVGVDLFFVLSGFLITGILVDTRESVDRFKSFYVRRILRLLPVYFTAVAIVIAGTHFLRGFRSWMNIPFFFYGSNLVALLPNADLAFPPYFNCGHFWSLALEEQFYTIWPFLAFFVPRRQTLIRVCLLGILAAPAIRLVAAWFGISLWVACQQLPARMDGLLLGALLALLVRGPNSQAWLNQERLKWVFWAGCGALVPVLAIVLRLLLSAPASTDALGRKEIVAVSLGITIFAVVFVTVLASSLMPGTIWNRIGSLRALRFFGKYSYGLYVWHYLFFLVTVGWVNWFRLVISPRFLADLLYCICMLCLFTGISMLSYSQIEVRFLRLKSRFKASPAIPDHSAYNPVTSSARG